MISLQALVTVFAAIVVIGMGSTGCDEGDTGSARPAYEPAGRVSLPARVIDAAPFRGGLFVLTRRLGTGVLDKVAAEPMRIVSSVPVASPQAVAFGWRSAWVAQFRRDRVLRFDARSGRRLAAIPLVLPRPVSETPDGNRFLPFDIAAGEGAVWVSTARGFVARIDPTTNLVTDQIALSRKIDASIAVGGGSVWVAGGPRGNFRIDPRTLRRTIARSPQREEEPLHPRRQGRAIAATGGVVWALQPPGPGANGGQQLVRLVARTPGS